MKDTENGGFYGQIEGNDQIIADADKGGILNARILWTFSSAYLHAKRSDLPRNGHPCKRLYLKHFFDTEFGGTYWTVIIRRETG